MVVKSLAVFIESRSLLLWLHVNLGPMNGPDSIGWLLGAIKTLFDFRFVISDSLKVSSFL